MSFASESVAAARVLERWELDALSSSLHEAQAGQAGVVQQLASTMTDDSGSGQRSFWRIRWLCGL